ncbi:MAG TPA: polysaccharide biosynthesis tyrosine autokinase, partial [Acidimicrobiales bacterium]|nr:polysaccharide biosynthesis tyrosine autokinase [Acidimicrobiales bacterium]
MASSVDVPELDLRRHLEVLRRRKRTIALVTVGLVLATVVASLVQTPIYEGEAQVLLQPSSTESMFDVGGAERPDADRIVETEIEVAESQPVQDAVEEQLGAVADVEASAVGSSDIIQLTARSPDRSRAAAAAKAYALAYIEFRRVQAVEEIERASDKIEAKVVELEARIQAMESPGSDESVAASRDILVRQQALFRQRLDELQVEAQLKTGGAQLVTQGEIPTSKVSPNPERSAVVASVLGLVLGIGLAFLIEYLDDSVKTKEDLDRVAGELPVLGLIPIAPGRDGPGSAVAPLTENGSPAAEAYRTLRTALQFLGVERAPRVFQVTSPSAAEGKSSTVANLGLVLSRAGQRVIVVDCDLRRACMHDVFGLPDTAGFTSLYLGDATLDSVLRPVQGEDHLRVLTAGPLPPNPSEVLSSKRTAEVLALIRDDCDVVVIDCPPVLPVADAAALSAWVDATLLVVAAGTTTKKDLRRAIELLRLAEAPVVGTVLNRTEAGDT